MSKGKWKEKTKSTLYELVDELIELNKEKLEIEDKLFKKRLEIGWKKIRLAEEKRDEIRKVK